MQRIIYSSPNNIEWDAQSAFKLTNYYTDKEDCMIFTYLKQYVHNNNFKICTYCFEKDTQGKQDLELCFNLNPEKISDYIDIEFGIDGINHIYLVKDNGDKKELSCLGDDISYHSFKANDQQGYYWCGELTISKAFIKNFFDTFIKEKSIITLNLYKIFLQTPDYACLFPDNEHNSLSKCYAMQEFVILNY